MVCTKCGAAMAETGKDTFSGREIREYACRSCGHTDWEDCGVALWQVLHDANEAAKAEAAKAEAAEAEEAGAGEAKAGQAGAANVAE
jgi:hypothetical protein